MEIEAVKINNPNAKNLIFGQAHFLKTIDDLYETLVSAVPGIKFGVAFAEASGSRLIRTSGNSPEMVTLATENLRAIGCGHTFMIFLENAYPINVLKAVQNVAEVVKIYCATANPVEVLVTRTKLGGGVIGVVDGASPLAVEDEEDKKERKILLSKLGYKAP